MLISFYSIEFGPSLIFVISLGALCSLNNYLMSYSLSRSSAPCLPGCKYVRRLTWEHQKWTSDSQCLPVSFHLSGCNSVRDDLDLFFWLTLEDAAVCVTVYFQWVKSLREETHR